MLAAGLFVMASGPREGDRGRVSKLVVSSAARQCLPLLGSGARALGH